MAVRTATAAAIDADIAQLKIDLAAYFALANQGAGDVDIRALFVRWLHGQLVNLDRPTALAARTSNLEDPMTWGKALADVDPLA